MQYVCVHSFTLEALEGKLDKPCKQTKHLNPKPRVEKTNGPTIRDAN